MCISRTYNPRVATSAAVSSYSKDLIFVQKPSLQELVFGPARDAKLRRKHGQQVVLHDYHDHGDDIDNGSPDPIARGGVTTPFPLKLHDMLDEIERDGHADVVSWQPHGRCFVVRKPKEFVNHIMPTYFKQSKFPSFQRQLNLYGFQRITKGPDKGGYYNELFLRGKVFLANRILRMRVKGTGVRARSNPETEPDFSLMPPVESSNPLTRGVSKALPREEPDIPKSSSLPVGDGSSEYNMFDDSDLGDFEGMKFHLLSRSDLVERELMNVDHYSPADMDHFLSQLNISKDLYQDIVDAVDSDADFGDLLQRVFD
jgi:HSF-type DNA-binding